MVNFVTVNTLYVKNLCLFKTMHNVKVLYMSETVLIIRYFKKGKTLIWVIHVVWNFPQKTRTIPIFTHIACNIYRRICTLHVAKIFLLSVESWFNIPLINILVWSMDDEKCIKLDDKKICGQKFMPLNKLWSVITTATAIWLSHAWNI